MKKFMKDWRSYLNEDKQKLVMEPLVPVKTPDFLQKPKLPSVGDDPNAARIIPRTGGKSYYAPAPPPGEEPKSKTSRPKEPKWFEPDYKLDLGTGTGEWESSAIDRAFDNKRDDELEEQDSFPDQTDTHHHGIGAHPDRARTEKNPAGIESSPDPGPGKRVPSTIPSTTAHAYGKGIQVAKGTAPELDRPVGKPAKGTGTIPTATGIASKMAKSKAQSEKAWAPPKNTTVGYSSSDASSEEVSIPKPPTFDTASEEGLDENTPVRTSKRRTTMKNNLKEAIKNKKIKKSELRRMIKELEEQDTHGAAPVDLGLAASVADDEGYWDANDTVTSAEDIARNTAVRPGEKAASAAEWGAEHIAKDIARGKARERRYVELDPATGDAFTPGPPTSTQPKALGPDDLEEQDTNPWYDPLGAVKLGTDVATGAYDVGKTFTKDTVDTVDKAVTLGVGAAAPGGGSAADRAHMGVNVAADAAHGGIRAVDKAATGGVNVLKKAGGDWAERAFGPGVTTSGHPGKPKETVVDTNLIDRQSDRLHENTYEANKPMKKIFENWNKFVNEEDLKELDAPPLDVRNIDIPDVADIDVPDMPDIDVPDLEEQGPGAHIGPYVKTKDPRLGPLPEPADEAPTSPVASPEPSIPIELQWEYGDRNYSGGEQNWQPEPSFTAPGSIALQDPPKYPRPKYDTTGALVKGQDIPLRPPKTPEDVIDTPVDAPVTSEPKVASKSGSRRTAPQTAALSSLDPLPRPDKTTTKTKAAKPTPKMRPAPRNLPDSSDTKTKMSYAHKRDDELKEDDTASTTSGVDTDTIKPKTGGDFGGPLGHSGLQATMDAGIYSRTAHPIPSAPTIERPDPRIGGGDKTTSGNAALKEAIKNKKIKKSELRRMIKELYTGEEHESPKADPDDWPKVAAIHPKPQGSGPWIDNEPRPEYDNTGTATSRPYSRKHDTEDGGPDYDPVAAAARTPADEAADEADSAGQGLGLDTEWGAKNIASNVGEFRSDAEFDARDKGVDLGLDMGGGVGSTARNIGDAIEDANFARENELDEEDKIEGETGGTSKPKKKSVSPGEESPRRTQSNEQGVDIRAQLKKHGLGGKSENLPGLPPSPPMPGEKFPPKKLKEATKPGMKLFFEGWRKFIKE